MDKIGTVEVLRARIYPLDAESHDERRSEVFVEPGVYDLYRDDAGAVFWLMRGRLNRGGIWRMGDGMFAVTAGDEVSGVEVVFPSRRFGPVEWAELMAGPELTEGGESQRLRVSLLEAVTGA